MGGEKIERKLNHGKAWKSKFKQDRRSEAEARMLAADKEIVHLFRERIDCMKGSSRLNIILLRSSGDSTAQLFTVALSIFDSLFQCFFSVVFDWSPRAGGRHSEELSSQ
jgi:hypothetical protein